MVTFGGRTTSAPYTKKKGVSLVARLGDVGYPIMRTEAHLSTFCHASSSHYKCGS
jgi:hypothetical protein